MKVLSSVMLLFSSVVVSHPYHQSMVPQYQFYVWHQGNAPVLMGHVSMWFCSLSSVSGKFEGGGEKVSVTIDRHGYWFLGGISNQVDVSAEAICVRR